MNVLLLGSGGRESALAWGLARSPAVREVVGAPGNPGIARLGDVVDLDPADPRAVLELARRIAADLVVVGPEAPLVAGIADVLAAEGFKVFGPSRDAARIEGSKTHAKKLMEQAGIPTAAARTFRDPGAARAYLDLVGPPFVVKADGLAAGKGVVVTSDRAEADAAIEERLVAGRFGDAGSTIVVEEYLDGEELSLIAFTDGDAVVVCEPAQDYKRARNGDRGPNTGGMGSYSPVPGCPPDLVERIVDEVLEPMVAATAAAGAPFAGALYAGLALTSRGPKVIEFNARFGDPETQALIPRLDSDLAEICLACAERSLAGCKLVWSPQPCVSVVLASGGYPGDYPVGLPIDGIEQAEKVPGVQVFHAGTAVRDGTLVTAGGRVLAISGVADDMGEARDRAYSAADAVSFQGKHLRTDIALRAIEEKKGREE